MVYYDDATNNTTAPTGPLAGSGWQWQGDWGNGSGTPISPHHFITAKHFDVGSSPFIFNGSTYHRTATADDPGSDLRIVTVSETFPTWAPLYAGSDEVGKEMVIYGRGYTRGVEETLDGTPKGWRWSSAGKGTRRWGTNVVSGLIDSGGIEDVALAAAFDADESKPNEAIGAAWDSGGGVFITEGSDWKLAGVTWAVSGYFDDDDDHGTGLPGQAGVFNAALFDMGGYYEGAGEDWTLHPDEDDDVPSLHYATRISARSGWIAGVVPEPCTASLLGASALALIGKRRRGRRRYSDEE